MQAVHQRPRHEFALVCYRNKGRRRRWICIDGTFHVLVPGSTPRVGWGVGPRWLGSPPTCVMAPAAIARLKTGWALVRKTRWKGERMRMRCGGGESGAGVAESTPAWISPSLSFETSPEQILRRSLRCGSVWTRLGVVCGTLTWVMPVLVMFRPGSKVPSRAEPWKPGQARAAYTLTRADSLAFLSPKARVAYQSTYSVIKS